MIIILEREMSNYDSSKVEVDYYHVMYTKDNVNDEYLYSYLFWVITS